MATILSPSSPSPHSEDHIPTATLALPPITGSAASRWSPDETVALIDAYKEKWYALRRGNLRANHWQEVADDLASRCPASPPKSAVQCRHKMEKLRKRYRAEIQRAATHGGVRRFTSAWVHFQNMHSMEKGSNPSPPSSDNEEDDDYKNDVKRITDSFNRHNPKGNFTAQKFDNNCGPNGFRIKIPGHVTAGPSKGYPYSNYDEISGQYPNNPNPNFANYVNMAANSKSLKEGFLRDGEIGKRAGEIPWKNNGDDGVGEVVSAIQALGDGFMRVEKAKMDMVRQIEELRREMELKRTEMILKSQQKIVEAVAKAMPERSSKRVKRNSTPPNC